MINPGTPLRVTSGIMHAITAGLTVFFTLKRMDVVTVDLVDADTVGFMGAWAHRCVVVAKAKVATAVALRQTLVNHHMDPHQ